MAASDFELIRMQPGGPTSAVIAGISGYRELSGKPLVSREAAPLVVPIVLNLGRPFRVGFDGADSVLTPSSFVAGLHPGAVEIRTDGCCEFVQVDLTPVGAYRLFGGALAEIRSGVVDLADAFGCEWGNLRDIIADAPDWSARLRRAVAFVLSRLEATPPAEVHLALEAILNSKGRKRITDLSAEMGCSRKHLAVRSKALLGVGPKTLARMARFHEAARLAASGSGMGWAAIADAAGYADQAHLGREFVAFSGETPTAWARRSALISAELVRPW